MDYPDNELSIWTFKYTCSKDIVSRTPPKTPESWVLMRVRPYDPISKGLMYIDLPEILIR